MPSSYLTDSALEALVEGVVKDIMERLEPSLRHAALRVVREVSAKEHRERARHLDALSATEEAANGGASATGPAASRGKSAAQPSHRERIIAVLEENGNKPLTVDQILRAVAGPGNPVSGSTRRTISRMSNSSGPHGETITPALVKTSTGRLKLNKD